VALERGDRGADAVDGHVLERRRFHAATEPPDLLVDEAESSGAYHTLDRRAGGDPARHPGRARVPFGRARLESSSGLCEESGRRTTRQEESTRMKVRRIAAVVSLVTLALALTVTTPPRAQEPVKVKMSRLTFPSLSTLMIDVVKAKGIDRKHGIDLEGVPFSAISGYYAGLATGEVDMLAGGPHVAQKMILEGVPISIAFTWARLNMLFVIAADPSIKTFADLKGKTIAADMGSSEYQILSIYGRSQGLVLGKDVTVVQAGPPAARTQLQAKRVDAIMTWEPTGTLTLRDDPKYHVVLNGDAAWKSVAGKAGWELVIVARHDFLKKHGAAVPRIVRMFQEGQQFMRANIDESEAILEGTVKMPRGVLRESLTANRLVYDVQPAWEGERAVIWDMFKIAVDHGYLPKLPDETAIWKP
jgi:ABC-type nitrate/sulfonate/bicarbonate transport system substrate-binding protein